MKRKNFYYRATGELVSLLSVHGLQYLWQVGSRAQFPLDVVHGFNRHAAYGILETRN